MIKSLYTTATGMKAQQTMVDVIANNIANVNTAGFKKSQASFEDLLYVTSQTPSETVPVGMQIGSGSRLAATTAVFTPGGLEITNRQLDVSISGDGFFEVLRADGSSAYTRDGHLLLNRDGKLVTKAGHILTPEVIVPPDVLDLNIDNEGRVTGRTAGSPDTSTTFGQIQIHRFVNPSGLLAAGNNLYTETSASGSPISGTPGANGLGELSQGFIEKSNVEVVNELVNLIVAQRAYEVNSRAIQASDQMLSTATNIVR